MSALKDLYERSMCGELYAPSGELQTYTRTSLERKGLLVIQVEDGGMWLRLTEAGRVEAGRVAIDWHILVGSSEHYIEMGYRERRNNNMAMSDVQYELMRKLEDDYNLHGMVFVNMQGPNALTVSALEKRGYIEVLPERRSEARATKPGLAAVVMERKERGEPPLEPVVRGGQRPNTDGGQEVDGIRAKVKPYSSPTNESVASKPIHKNQAEDCVECAGCVERTVREMLIRWRHCATRWKKSTR